MNMTTVLKLNTSIYSTAGASSKIADEFIAATRVAAPGTRVLVRDLAVAPVPHLTEARFKAFTTKPEARTTEERAIVAYSDLLIEELRRADVIVIGLPMYNFGIPSTLKAYFDHVARAGETFLYTEKGPVGLLTGKKAYVFAARGGVYVGTPLDTETTYVRDFLRFLGITDVEFVYAEGLAISEASKQAALAQARRDARRLNVPELEAA
jgi:FMN-dependent NADH-azoreductase